MTIPSRLQKSAIALIGIIGSIGAAIAQNQSESSPHSFRLNAPEIVKIDWNTRALNIADLDRDGLLDLVLINNSKANITLLYRLEKDESPGQSKRSIQNDRWEPPLEDARFEKDHLTTAVTAFDLAVGDLDGDDIPDIVYTNDRDELIIHYQQKNNQWSDPERIDLDSLAEWTQTLEIADLDGDQQSEIVLLSKSELLVLKRTRDKKEPWQKKRYPLSQSEAYGLTIADCNADGSNDILYLYDLDGDQSYAILRFQNRDGSFSAEEIFRLPTPTSVLTPTTTVDGPFRAVYISEKTGVIESALFQKKPALKKEPALRPLVYAVPTNHTKPCSFTWADFNADGRLDIVASDGPGAQVWFFAQENSGRFGRPTSFPSFSEIVDLDAGDMDGDGQPELIVTSSQENALGVSQITANGRVLYPSLLPLKNSILFTAAADLNGDGIVEIAYLHRQKNNLGISFLKKIGSSWGTIHVEWKGRQRKPQGLEFFDINQDGRLDLLAYFASDPLEILLQDEQGNFQGLRNSAEFPKGLTDRISPSAISYGDIDGDGLEELILSRKTYARGVKLDPEGNSVLIDQFNSPDTKGKLLLTQLVDIDGDRQSEALLLDGKKRELVILKRDSQNVYRFERSFFTGISHLGAAHLGDSDGDGHLESLYFGKNRFWCLPLRPRAPFLHTSRLYESNLENVTHQRLAAGDLNGDGRFDLVAIDNQKSRVMEILLQEKNAWKSAMHFKIFEIDPHYRGRRGGNSQPHEMQLADIDGDGQLDILLLIHDRLLLYTRPRT